MQHIQSVKAKEHISSQSPVFTPLTKSVLTVIPNRISVLYKIPSLPVRSPFMRQHHGNKIITRNQSCEIKVSVRVLRLFAQYLFGQKTNFKKIWIIVYLRSRYSVRHHRNRYARLKNRIMGTPICCAACKQQEK